MSDGELEGGRLVSDPNANRPGYKETKVGWIPEDWDVRQLGEIITLKRGYDLPNSNRVNGEFPVISSAGCIARHNEAKCSPPGIVTGRYGSIGQVHFIDESYWPLNTTLYGQNFHGNYPRFLYYLLGAFNFQQFSDKTGVPGVNRNDLHRELVRCPPLPEQRKIAAILRTWDEAIEAATKLVTALNTRREALRTKLVVEADLGGRPTVFGEFLTESRILGSDGASARKITVKLYGKGAVPKSDKRDGSAKTRYYRRAPGQLIYSKLDFLNGAFALVPESLQGYESSLDLPAFDISEQVNPKWLIEYLTRPTYYTAQLHLARGQRKARRIAPNDFLASPVKLPQRARQDEIAEVLAVADCEIDLRVTELDTLTRQKRGLMQKLLTGEWRVGRLMGLSSNDEI